MMSEANSSATAESVTDIPNEVELALVGANCVVFASEVMSDFKLPRSATTSARAEIWVFFSVICLFNESFFGATSASTKLSTIWVMLRPEPF